MEVEASGVGKLGLGIAGTVFGVGTPGVVGGAGGGDTVAVPVPLLDCDDAVELDRDTLDGVVGLTSSMSLSLPLLARARPIVRGMTDANAGFFEAFRSLLPLEDDEAASSMPLILLVVAVAAAWVT